MKAVLVYPRYKYPLVSGTIEPLGIQYIASVLEKEGVQVEMLDMTFDTDLERLKRSVKDASYVGISFTTPLFTSAVEMLRCIKSVNKDLVTIAGGSHPTIDQVSTLGQGFDYAVIGEGERTIVEFNKNFQLGKPEKTRGIAYKKDGEIIVNEPMPVIENLDDVPFPSRHLIDYPRYDTMAMLASRGCKFNCRYCQPVLRRIFGKSVRMRSLLNVIEEIDVTEHKYPGCRFSFNDDTLTMHDAAWFEEFGKELRKRKLKIRYVCNSRVDTIDFEKAKILKESGCIQINFGVESGSEKVLKFYRKGANLEQAKKVFKEIKKLDMILHAYIMLGAPEETKEDLNATYEFIKTIRPDKIQTFNVTPVPGTDLYDYCEENDLLNIEKLEDFDNSVNSYRGVVPIKLKYLDRKDIEEVKRKIDFFMLRKSIFNLRILKVFFTDPRRIIRALGFYVKKYLTRENKLTSSRA